ncbi:cyclin-dependent protein kinase inhibitor SMR10-like isoform X1 [Juglans microcarpa x Juglans regia]|uniref:cyclin-dependent protein kinase inhibitor SMR10-like isoform X1 n=2 Tax=Juglans microcarpa x Juglans regia TaxID=2249226 RepID=UPI001B7E7546|nr:cyclin-dependent protein kinase inhibitor SMR10-like isoform X1 [Juglans microcarpa x Juglans regia]
MGVSDSQMLVSDKDLNVMKLNFATRPALEFQDECKTEPPEDRGVRKIPEVLQEEEQEYQKQEQDLEQEQEKEDKHDSISLSSLGVRIPSLGEFRDIEEEDDGFKTPTSLDHKIPVFLQCPPAPRKLKPKAVVTTKRKAARRRIPLDLSNEIELLFPPSTLQALDLSGKIRKIREGDETR